MRKIISVTYLFCFFSMINFLSAQVTFTASDAIANCDDATVCVNISVNNFDSVTSFQHVYDWDTTVLQNAVFTDLVPEGFGVSPNPDSLAVGRGPYTWFSFPHSTFADGTVIAEFCFTPNNLGSTTLDFEGTMTTILTVSQIINGVNTPDVPAVYNPGTITVQDATAPVIVCPSDTIIESSGTNVFDIAPVSAMDNCDLTSITYDLTGATSGSGVDDASGELFLPDTTMVTYTAMDGSGNAGTCSFDVILNPPPPDTGALQFIPEVNLDCETGNVSVNMLVVNFDSIVGMQFGMQWDTAALTYLSTTNNLPPAPTYNQVNDSTLSFFWFPFSGNPLTLGDSSVLFTLNFTLNGSISSPVINFTGFPGIPIGVGQIQNGSTVPLTQDVDFFFMPEIFNIIDNTGPTITGCPSDINMSTDLGLCTASVTWTPPTITDNCGIDTIIVSDMPGNFPIGVDTVSYIVIDLGGNSDTCSFIITVTDNENPVISCPGNVTVPADFGSCENTTVNIGTATATDNCGVASVTSDAPATFPVGTTTVTWTATDVNGNVSTCSHTVTVEDNENPSIICPPDISQCPGTAVNLGSPTTDDNCGVATVTNDAPGSFPIGLTIVTWTVTDVNGNTNTCQQNVTIEDNEAPMITCPLTDAVDAEPGLCTAVYSNNLTPIATDNCDMDLTITYTITTPSGGTVNGNNDATGETFEVGTSTLTYYAVDDAGNIDSCSSLVQINDNQLPMITCIGDTTIFVSISTTDTVVNNIGIIASDNCGIASTTFTYDGVLTGPGVGSDASGTSFPVGSTTVTYYVTDVNGNLDSCNFDVNILVVSNDLIGCQPDQVLDNDLGLCSAVVNGIAPTLLVPSGDIDNIVWTLTGATTGNGNDDASGETFNVGTTTLEYIATDNFGNMDTCTLDITVNDVENPIWTNCPGNITTSVNLTTECSAIVSWTTPIPSDNCGNEQFIISHVPGDTFGLGTTTVTYVAIDSSGNIGICEFDVTVEDNSPPVADNCPVDITVDATPGQCNADVSWVPVTGSDECSAVTVFCTHNPGDTFNVGTTTVTCTLTDGSGNSSMCSFDVIVQDNSAPIPQNCPNDIDIAPNFDDCQAIVNWTPPTFLDCPPVSITSTHEPGDTFSLGTTTVIYIAIDQNGNDTTCTFDINVIDNEAPVPSCPSDITVNSLSKDCGAFVNWPMPTATDNCDPNPSISQVPSPGIFFPIGNTTVTVTATDNAGNDSICTFVVTVQDAIGPQWDCPSEDIVISIDGTIISDVSGLINGTGANPNCDSLFINYSMPGVTDNCSVESVEQDTLNNILTGGAFPIGTSTIQYTAFDASGNFSICTFNIIVEPLEPVVVGIVPNDTVCVGENVQFVTNITAPGATFNWTGPNGWSSTASSPTVSNVTLDSAGVYSVTVQFLSGCTSIGSETLVVTEAPQVTALSNAPICTEEDIQLDVEVPPGQTVIGYSWSGPNNFTSNISNPTAQNAGTYEVTVTYDNGCVSTSSVNVTIINLPAPEVDLDCISDICLGSSCVLTGTEYAPAPDVYNWSATPTQGAGLPANTDNNQIVITPTEPGIYIYNYSVQLGDCVSEEASQIVVVHGSPNAVDDAFDIEYETPQDIIVTSNDTFSTNIGVNISIVSGTSNGTLINNGDGTFSYTPNDGFIGTDQFTYEICYDCGSLLCDFAVVTLTINDDRDCVFPTVITPNKDGFNDALFINCLANNSFPNNEIIIYNQWGDEVFTAAPYQNNWEGTHDGNDLPDGTYFMVFRLDDNAEVIKQFITIFR